MSFLKDDAVSAVVGARSTHGNSNNTNNNGSHILTNNNAPNNNSTYASPNLLKNLSHNTSTPLTSSSIKKATSLMSLQHHHRNDLHAPIYSMSNHSGEDHSPENSEYTFGTINSEDCLDNIKVHS
jgi:hypothetical protein